MASALPLTAGARRGRRGRAALTCAALAWLFGCVRTTMSPSPTAFEPSGPTQDAAGSTATAVPALRQISIDGAAMTNMVAALADDRLGGRYTFAADDLRAAADLLAAAYRDAGVGPLGEDYLAPFGITIGAENVTPPVLELGPAGARRTLRPGTFAARAVGSSGDVEGELAFVGYAARSRESTPRYDDLAGIDLQGKVALVLLEAPARPNPAGLERAVRGVIDRFNRETAALREAKAVPALRFAHQRLHRELVQLLSLRRRGLAGVAEAEIEPEDLLAPADADLWLKIARAENHLEGAPRFDPRAALLTEKLTRLAAAGVAGVILVEGPHSLLEPHERQADLLPNLTTRTVVTQFPFPVVQLRWHDADRWIRIGGRKLSAVQQLIDRRLVPQSRVLRGIFARIKTDLAPMLVPADNVVAAVPGHDLAEEVVVIGAHYDHIGRATQGPCHAVEVGEAVDSICNGADDNASGTAMVVELARVFASAGVKPRRTLVFANFAGEEVGLLGSSAFVDGPPPGLGEKKVVAMINLDMVGRLGPKGLAVGGVGSSLAWMPMLEGAGTVGMRVLYERAVTSRSDHANFYRQGIPVLFFFTGLHDDYHAAGDEADKINAEGMVKVATLVAGVVDQLAQGAAISFAEPRTPDEGLVGSLPGSNPVTVERVVVP